MTARTTRYEAALDRLADRRAVAAELATEVAAIRATPVSDLAAALADTDTDDQLADWIGVTAEAVNVWWVLLGDTSAIRSEDALVARSA